MYAYAGNDPVNSSDPSGLKHDEPKPEFEGDRTPGGRGSNGGSGGFSGGGGGIKYTCQVTGGVCVNNNTSYQISPAGMAFRFAAAGGFGFTGGSGGTGGGGGGSLTLNIPKPTLPDEKNVVKDEVKFYTCVIDGQLLSIPLSTPSQPVSDGGKGGPLTSAIGQAGHRLGQPTLPKPRVGLSGGGKAGNLTSPASVISRRMFTSKTRGHLGTGSVGGMFGRSVPILGGFGMVVGAISMGQDLTAIDKAFKMAPACPSGV